MTVKKAGAEKLDVLVEISEAVYDAIKASPNGLPSGHLYAVLQGAMNLDIYNAIISALVTTGKITNRGHLLKVV